MSRSCAWSTPGRRPWTRPGRSAWASSPRAPSMRSSACTSRTSWPAHAERWPPRGLPPTLAAVDRVRWGIIGVGDVTERKSGPGFQQAERSELVAVMRRNGELAADYARRHYVPRWYADADELINDPEVDAVYVATPPDSHRDYVRSEE